MYCLVDSKKFDNAVHNSSISANEKKNSDVGDNQHTDILLEHTLRVLNVLVNCVYNSNEISHACHFICTLNFHALC